MASITLSGSPSSLPSVSLDWVELQSEMKKVIGFFRSINEKSIGTGLANYAAEEFVIKPRSTLFNSHAVAWLTNIGNPEATFEEVQGGFLELKVKLQKIGERLELFSPKTKDDSAKEAKEMLLSLVRGQIAVYLVAMNGLQKLHDNYVAAGKEEKAQILGEMGIECFDLMQKIQDTFEEKFFSVRPDVKYVFDSRMLFLATLMGMISNDPVGSKNFLIHEETITNLYLDPIHQALL